MKFSLAVIALAALVGCAPNSPTQGSSGAPTQPPLWRSYAGVNYAVDQTTGPGVDGLHELTPR